MKLLSTLTLAALTALTFSTTAHADEPAPPVINWKWDHPMLDASTSCPPAIHLTNVSDYVWYYSASYGPSQEPLMMWELSDRFPLPFGGPPPLAPGATITIDLTPAGSETSRVFIDNGQMLEVPGQSEVCGVSNPDSVALPAPTAVAVPPAADRPAEPIVEPVVTVWPTSAELRSFNQRYGPR